MKIGYKGLNMDMTASQGSVKEKYELGQVYTKVLSTPGAKPRVCTSDGYHYCDKLKDVDRYYSFSGAHRYFKIEILGAFADNGDKSITTSFKLLEEIDKEVIETSLCAENLNLETVQAIQKQYPMMHVGGSTALFLHGVRLKRWLKSKSGSDLDFISPYFILPDEKIKSADGTEDLEVDFIDQKASANDFDVTFLVDGTKVDYRIDPKQRYEVVEFNGVKYKVSPLITILEAKMRYAMQPGGDKHREDITEMVTGGRKKVKDDLLDFLK